MNNLMPILLICFTELILIIAISIPALWWGSRVCGWHELGQKYRCNNPYEGEWKGWQWARFKWSKTCYVWTAVAPEGFYIKLMPAFSFITASFFPPLCIPWSALRDLEERKFWWKPMLEISFIDSAVRMMLQRTALEGAERFLPGKLKYLDESTKLIED